jgi:hypothetical protein
VWVPTSFHASVFAAGGVAESAIQVIGEPVDTRFFSPATPPLQGLPKRTDRTHVFLSVFKVRVCLMKRFEVPKTGLSPYSFTWFYGTYHAGEGGGSCT